MSYTKNSVKLLKTVSQHDNKLILYTEFDGKYEVGDKLYIMVLDSGSTEYILDSFQSSSSTYRSIGYELLNKDGNKLIIDIDVDKLSTPITGLTENNCYIGRTYIKSGSITNGIIYGTLLYNVTLTPKNNLSLPWYQGILVTSSENVTNINFNSNSDGQLILKSEVNADGTINSYYTINNYNNGLSIINLSGRTMLLVKCDINSGIFTNCDLDGKQNSINNGILNNCRIGRTYIVNGGEFINCRLDPLVIWNYGKWSSDWDGTNPAPFGPSTWKDGTWLNGIFPYPRAWNNGRFLKGVFMGKIWNNGSFGTKDSISEEAYSDTIFSGSSWMDGNFNGGLMRSSSWNNGYWYNGLIKDGSIWNDGTFNGGYFSGSTWKNGIFNNGEVHNSTWINGTFNGGTMYDSTWQSGIFNGGSLKNTNWLDGSFYNGKMEDGTWYHGAFYKGSMFGTRWMDGDLYYGLMNFVKWSGGTWHNGIANSVTFSGGTWVDGIFNYGWFNYGLWLNGSFNSGFFSGVTHSGDAIWKGGNFYFGEFAGDWQGGTFHTGRNQTFIDSKYIINREYYQYNKAGLISNRYKTVRLPAKRKY